MSSSPEKKTWHFLFITSLTLLTFLIQYLFRAVDDNRLTSWKWAFAGRELFWFFPLILAAVIILYGLLRSPVARQRPVLFLFCCSFALSALFWSVPEVIIDAARYVTQAKHLELYGTGYFLSQWGGEIVPWTDLPLVPFLYGMIFSLFGEERAFVQVLNACAFSLTTVVTFLIGRALWDEETGLCAGILLWGIPYLFSQTPLMLVDVTTMFFLVLSLYSFIMALEKGGGWMPFSGLSVFCAAFAKYSSWMMLSVLGLIFLVYLLQGDGIRGRVSGGGQGSGIWNPVSAIRKSRRTVLQRGLFTAFIAGFMIGTVLLLKSDIIAEQVRFLREYQAPGLRRWGESFLSTFIFQAHPFITAAALWSVVEATRKKDIRYLIIIWLVLLVVMLQIRRSRYVMVVFPMVALMAGYGLQALKSQETRRYALSCIVAASLCVAVFAYRPFLQSMSAVNFKNAGELLDTLGGDWAEVITVPSPDIPVNLSAAVPILDLFTARKIIFREGEGPFPPPEGTETSPLR
ncbi:MAG: glycosyltransferase family 39 protein, partial [Nitrospiraceae bacterium]